MGTPAARSFWLDPATQTSEATNASQAGLSSRAAADALRRFGPNVVSRGSRQTILRQIGRRLVEPLVAILLVAAAVSGLTGDRASLVIITAMVLLSIGLDVYQERNAQRAADELKKSIAIRVRVRRDGAVRLMDASEVVPGDIVELSPGDLIPADGIVIAATAARANEALMTGEPYPVEKRPGPSGAANPADAYDALFGGTALVSGNATMLVLYTGANTALGGIASALETNEPPTAFERGVHRLGMLILRLTLFLVLFVLLAHLAFHRPPLESFMFAVALAVGLTPELLPMVTTVTLSRGAVRMARRQVIVKKLSAIHDLGSMDVLCTDKTGTLTEARIELAGWPGPDGANDDAVLTFASVEAQAHEGGNPLDAAIIAHAAGTSGYAVVRQIPFDFDRRRSSVVATNDGKTLLITKGAPEAMLALCPQIRKRDGSIAVMDDARRQQIAQMHDTRAGNGERLLAVAYRPCDQNADTGPEAERDLIFAGFCAFLDPPKASAAAAIRKLQAQGVRVKVLSGDAAPVVRHLVSALGIEAHEILTGDEIRHMSHAARRKAVRRVDLFARVSPDQKVQIIQALSEAGHTVGFIGDGINDAPAIRAADAGLSVQGATDVARAAADMILLAPDLGVLASGVEEGRRTYANIMKYVRMGTSSNFGNMLSMALASLVLPFLPMTAIQILLNNLLYDFSQTGLPFDHVDHADEEKPHGWDMKEIVRFTLVMGPLSSVFDIATFLILLYGFEAAAPEFRTAWFIESIITQTLVIFIIRTRVLPWRSRPNPAMATLALSALAVALFLALGPLQGWFGFVPLPPMLLLSILGLALTYLVVAEYLKRIAIAAKR